MKKIIENFRETSDYSILEAIQYNEVDGFDTNYYTRGDLIFELYEKYDHQDKLLIKWLINEELKGIYQIEDDTLILCAFMLYKIMDAEDVTILYKVKFGGGTDLTCRVDTELIFGIDRKQTKEYLNQLNTEESNEILECIQHYESQKGAVYKVRNEYIKYFENKRFNGLKEYFEEEKNEYIAYERRNNEPR